MNKPMDIPALRAFTVISQTGSFSAAAAVLYITQPAVSKRLLALETQVGSRLFDRSGRRLHLTEAGRILLPQAQRILDEIDQARRLVRNLNQTVAGPLKFGTSHHIGLHHLPGLLRDFSTRHPHVELDIQFQESELAYQAVRENQLEFAFVTLTGHPPPGITERALWADPLAFVAAPDQTLSRQRDIHLADLTGFRAILPPATSHTFQLIHARFEQATLPLTTTLPVSYLETIKMMVSVGLGWSVLPETMLDSQLYRLPLATPPIERQLGVITRTGRTLSNAALAFLPPPD